METQDSPATMIVVENLTKTYGRGKPAIQDISLTISKVFKIVDDKVVAARA